MPDRPGVLSGITQALGAEKINIEDFELQHMSPERGGTLTVLVSGEAEAGRAAELLGAQGYSVIVAPRSWADELSGDCYAPRGWTNRHTFGASAVSSSLRKASIAVACRATRAPHGGGWRRYSPGQSWAANYAE